jgi:hypothetical protein
VFNGMPVATDAVSQTKYIGAVVGAQIDPNAVINWKMADGTFVTLDAQAITAVAMAVRAHVQACFNREAVLKAEIEVATKLVFLGLGFEAFLVAQRPSFWIAFGSRLAKALLPLAWRYVSKRMPPEDEAAWHQAEATRA